MNSPYTSLQPQSFLAVPFVCFARQRSYGYASSQEQSNGTHQEELHFTDGGIQRVL
jgi:hypothetical protein